MKKTFLSLITLSLVTALGLTSCVLPEDEELDNDASGDASVTISINNLNSFYLPSETISWEEVTLTLDFTDPDINDVTLTKGAFDVDELKEEDEFILYTSGLYALSNIEGEDIPEGDYPISYYLVYDEIEYSGSLFSVTITADPSEIYSVFEFSEPEFAIKYKENLAQVSEEGGTDNEDKFFKAPEYYEVGDDNPFIYKPELILWDKRGTSFALESVDSYSASATVTHLVEGEEEEVDLSSNEYVSYSNFAFDFTEKAVGEVFTLSISLNNFASDINSNTIPTYSFTVKVEEGYNVYDAIDLGRMSLFDEENHVVEDDETLTASDFEYGESYYNIFFDYDEDGEPTYVRKSYPDIWESFYEEKGVVDASEVKGLFIHDDITITENDLPSDFLISAEEAVTMAGSGADFEDMVGSIRDGVIIYNHLMDTEDFTLNGNLFTIDASTLKWCLTRAKTGSADRNGDIEGTALDFYAEQSAELQVSEGTATLFAFDGYKMEWSNTNYGIILEPKATAYVSNLEVNGNMEGNGNTYTDEAMIGQLASGTMTFCKSVCAQSVVDNVISKHFLTAYYAEKTTSSWTCFDVSHAKIYDCYGVAFVIYVSGDNFVDNSEIKRFGGPVALMFCAEDEEGYFKGYNYAGFTMGENVTAETPLAGDEAWFQIYGLSEYLTLFGAFDAFFAGGNGLGAAIDGLVPDLGGLASGFVTCTDYGKTMLDEDGKFNLLSFGMERHTTGSKLYMDFSFGDLTAKIDPDLTIENTSSLTKEDFADYETVASIFYGNSSYCNAVLSALGIINITLPLPLFMTNTGKIFTPSFTGFLSFTGTLFDVSEWLYEIEVEGKTTSTASKNAVQFTEEDTMVFMYYPLDLTGMNVDFNITFAMSMSLYDKPSEEQ